MCTKSSRLLSGVMVMCAALLPACGGGGAGSDGARDDPVRLSSTETIPAGMGPSESIRVRAAAGGYDPVSNRLILYFASNPSVSGLANEVWVIRNGNGLGGEPAWQKIQTTGSSPDNLNTTNAVYDEVSNRLIVYGGCFANCSPAQASIYTLSNANGVGGTAVWQRMSVADTDQGRAEHSVVFDSGSNRMITFGGHRAFFGTDLRDTRVLSGANGAAPAPAWSTLQATGTVPGARGAHRAVYDRLNDRMIIFGGQNSIKTCCPYVVNSYDDTWVLSGAGGLAGTPRWTKVETAGVLPLARAQHSAVYDPIRNTLLVLGGYAFSNSTQTYTEFGDGWELTNANGLFGPARWRQVVMEGQFPLKIATHFAAFDHANGRMVVVGSAEGKIWILVRSGGGSK